MGQTKSKPFPSSLTSNSWRRLSDSDCLHLLGHPEYFDNQLMNIEQTKLMRRSGSTSTFFDANEQSSIDQQSSSSSMTPSPPPIQSNNTTPILSRNQQQKQNHNHQHQHRRHNNNNNNQHRNNNRHNNHNPHNHHPHHHHHQNVVIRSISMSSSASSTAPLYRNSMYPGCVDHHQDHESIVKDRPPVPVPAPVVRRCSPTSTGSTGTPAPPLPPPPTAAAALPPPITAKIRPISMFALDDITTEVDDGNVQPTTMIVPSPPIILPSSTNTPMANSGGGGGSTSIKQIDTINLSLNDLLEQANATESVRLRRNHGKSSPFIIGHPTTHMTVEDDDSNETLVSKSIEEQDEIQDEQQIVVQPIGESTVESSAEHQQKQQQQRQHQVNNTIRCSGLDCMCDRCIQNRFKLLNWLLPNCTRMNSERLLSGKPDGTFLVRKSEKFPGQYTLSFVCRRAVRHCLIMRSVYGFGLRWPYSFETLQQVIIHYSRNSLTEFNSKLNIHLKYPVFSA